MPQSKENPFANNIIWQVQRYLYQTLKNNPQLNQDKLSIFHQIPKNTPFPYIYLGKFMVMDNSLKTVTRLQLYNDIHLYSQTNTLQEILSWAEIIKQTLTKSDVFLENCHIGEINFKQMELDIMNDAKIYRVISKFKLLVEEIYNKE
jgi:hypothetical protein